MGDVIDLDARRKAKAAITEVGPHDWLDRWLEGESWEASHAPYERQQAAFIQRQQVKLAEMQKQDRRWRMTSKGEIFYSQAPERELDL